jgi:hypothetical protein
MFEMEIIAMETASFADLCSIYGLDPEDNPEK